MQVGEYYVFVAEQELSVLSGYEMLSVITVYGLLPAIVDTRLSKTVIDCCSLICTPFP